MTAISSDEEEHDAEMERRTKRWERLETGVMVFQAALALLAVSGIVWWATGHYVLVPVWLTIVALQAVTQIYAQRTIRLLRRANRDLSQHTGILHKQHERLMDAFRLGPPRVDPW